MITDVISYFSLVHKDFLFPPLFTFTLFLALLSIADECGGG